MVHDGLNRPTDADCPLHRIQQWLGPIGDIMDPRLIIGYSLLAILFIFFMVCLVAGIEYQSYRLDLCYRAIYSILKDNPGFGE